MTIIEGLQDRFEEQSMTLQSSLEKTTFSTSETPSPESPKREAQESQLSYRQKRRQYGFRVREVERGSFTPLVFTTNGGAAPEAATFRKCLASQISDKKNEPYSVVMNFLRCRLSFSLLRSSLLCLRGSRSNRSLNTTCLGQDSLSLVASEGRLKWIITCSWHVPSLFVCLSECICLIALSIFVKQHTYSTFRLRALFLLDDMLFHVRPRLHEDDVKTNGKFAESIRYHRLRTKR